MREAQCPNCGAPQESLVKLGSTLREGFDWNSLMVECLDCHTTPTREACRQAFASRPNPKPRVTRARSES